MWKKVESIDFKEEVNHATLLKVIVSEIMKLLYEKSIAVLLSL